MLIWSYTVCIWHVQNVACGVDKVYVLILAGRELEKTVAVIIVFDIYK